MVETRQQRHFAFDASELLAGGVDLDALHSIVATIKIVLNLNQRGRINDAHIQYMEVTSFLMDQRRKP